MASKHLKEICGTDPDLVVREVEVMRHPLQSWQDGIRLIPAVKIETDILSSVYLDRETLSGFILDHKKLSSSAEE